MNKWKIWGLTAALSAVFAVSGCQKQADSPQNTQQNKQTTQSASTVNKSGSGAVIGYAHCCARGAISNMDETEDTIKQLASESGAKLIFETANESQNKDNLNIQVEQVKRMIDQGAKSVIVVFMASKGEDGNKFKTEILEYAKSKGVSVVATRRTASNKLHQQFSNVISVGSSSEEAGVYQAKMVVDQWKKHPEWDLNEDGKMQFVVLQGAKNNENLLKRTTFFMRTLNGSDLSDKFERIPADEDTNTDRNIAKEIVSNWIATGKTKQMEVIVANTDDLILGALDAFKEANEIPLPMFSINGIQEAQDAVQKGEILGTVIRDTEAQSRYAYQIAENLAMGRKAMEGIDAQLEGGTTLNVPYKILVKE
ncbi:MAG: substrate-binding domain-containing protein [Neisseriaceae bacterium]|nr:substrate-binding domain-containing protein [Neisseriaceae bacterium]